MPNVQRYFPQVGLPNPVTGVPQTGATPIADTIGKIAGVGQDLAQAYYTAKYDQDTSDLMLQFKKDINAYQENLRVNPIQAGPNDDIVQLKEQDWQKFSEDRRKNIIDKIDDPRLQEDISNWWSSTTEDYRAAVIDNAMDENITYMAQRRQEDILNAIDDNDWQMTDALIATGVENGTLSRDGAKEFTDFKQLKQILAETDSMSIEDAETTINESLLDTVEKEKAMVFMLERRKIRDTEIEEATKAHDDQNYAGIFDLVINSRITSLEQLSTVLGSVQDAEFEGRSIPGTADAFRADHISTLTGIVRAMQNERNSRAKGADPETDPIVKSTIEQMLLSESRGSIMEYMTSQLTEGKLTTDYREKVIKRMNSGVTPRLNDTGAQALEDGINSLVRDKIITDTQKFSVYERFGSFIQQFSPEEIASEKYYEELDSFFNNIRSEEVSWNVSKLQETLREEDNFNSRNTQAERFLVEGELGRFTGQVNISGIETYLKSPSPNTDVLRESTSGFLYGGKSYKDLDRKEKNKVNLSVAVAEYSKSVLRIAGDEIGPGGRLAMDKDGLPMVKYGTGAEETTYKLLMNEDGTEEQWYRYGRLGVEGQADWYPTGIEIPHRAKTPGFIKTAIEEITSILEETSTVESQEIADELEKNILGNMFFNVPNIGPSKPTTEIPEEETRIEELRRKYPGLRWGF